MAELDPHSAEYAAGSRPVPPPRFEFHSRDGYAIESQVGTVLGGLGFPQEDWHRRTEEFSGGWQMRIALAKLLLEKPNLLLLDEPTNHLDLEARNWLEEYLQSYPNAFVLISHDRYFLDVTVNKIAEIWNKSVTFYTGNYEKYLAAEGRAPGAAARRPTATSATASSSSKPSSTASATRPPRRSRSRAGSKSWRRSSGSRSRRKRRPSTSRSRSPNRAAAIVAEFKNVSKSYGEKHRVRRRELHGRARRPGRTGGSERRRQIDADQAVGGNRAADARATIGWGTTSSRITSRRISTKSWIPTRACWTTSRRSRRGRPIPSCAACSGVSCSRKTTCSSRSACCPAANGTGTRWRACCMTPRISCCWTSRPTTWICGPRTCC